MLPPPPPPLRSLRQNRLSGQSCESGIASATDASLDYSPANQNDPCNYSSGACATNFYVNNLYQQGLKVCASKEFATPFATPFAIPAYYPFLLPPLVAPFPTPFVTPLCCPLCYPILLPPLLPPFATPFATPFCYPLFIWDDNAFITR